MALRAAIAFVTFLTAWGIIRLAPWAQSKVDQAIFQHYLAARFAEGATTPDECIRRTLDYLTRECQYSLEVGAFHSRQPVAEFLFEKK